MQTTLIGALVSAPLAAQVTPAGQTAPTMDMAANGTPVVRITTPNAAGVSHNTYSDFNVDGRGLILNNSQQIVTTTLAGYVDGNRNLKRSGPASLILNEVTGGNPSTLAGYVEVAGPAAQVVIANANGIACNGCGFINSHWATLTTGTAVFGPAGGLAGFTVGGGTLGVDGKGLDASGMRLDLFARALNVNAGIWADRINAVTGTGDVTIAGSDDPIVVTARKTDETRTPAFALDVAAVGGMYARSIRLIGTEAGLGVRIDGTLASLEQGFSLTSAGDLVLGGRAVATTTAALQAAGTTTVTGTLYGAQGTTITSGGALVNSGLVGSGRDVTATVGSVDSSGTLVAGLNQDGSLADMGDLAIASSGPVRLSGQTVAPGALSLTAGAIDLASGVVQAARATLTAGAIAQAGGGQLLVSGKLDLHGGTLVSAGSLQGGDVTFGGTSLENAGSLIATNGLTLATTGRLSNSGAIQSDAATRITADGIDNRGGTIVNVSTADMAIVTRGALVNQGGTIGGNGVVGVDVGALDTSGMDAARRGTLIAGTALTVTARSGAIDADGGMISAGGTLGLTAAQGAITARGGEILSGGSASVTGGTVDLSGGTLWTGDLALRATRLVNVGGTLRASGSGTSTIMAGALDNFGGGLIHADGQDLSLIIGSPADAGANAGANADADGGFANAGGRIDHAGSGVLTVLATGDIVNSGGSIATNGALRLDAPTLDNAGGVISAQGAATLAMNGALTNSGGVLTAGGAVGIRAGAIDNRAGGAIVAAGSDSLAIVSSGAIASQGGTIGGRGDVTVSAGAIDVSGTHPLGAPGQAGGNGQLSAGGTLTATATQGAIRADQGGLIAAGTDATLIASDAVQAISGTLDIGGVATLRAGAVNLDGGTLAAASFAIDAGSVSLRHSRFIQTGTADLTLTSAGTLDYSGTDFTANAANFTLTAGRIANVGGALRHAGSGLLSLTAATLDNRDGLIATAGTLSVDVAGLGNQGGQLSAAGDATITASAALANGAGDLTDANGAPVTGTIIAGQALSLRAGNVDNIGGDIEATGPLTATIASLTGAGGQIKSTGGSGALTLTATGAVSARGGLIGSNGAARVRAGSIDIGGAGTLSAATALDIAAAGTIQADTGSLSGQTLTLSAPALVLDGGTLTGDTLDLTLGALGNVGGTISATGRDASRIAVAGTLANAGTIQANSSDLAIDAGVLRNSGDGIRHYGTGTLTIVAPMLDTSGPVTTGGALVLRGETLSNSGMISAVGSAGVTATTRFANSGTVASNAALTLAGGSVTNSGTVAGGDGITASLAGYDGDTGRLLAGRSDIAGDAATVNLTLSGAASARGGTIAATGLATLRAASIDVGAGGVLSGSSVTARATAGDIAAIGGTIQAGVSQAAGGQGQAFVPGTLMLDASGTIDASGAGAINGGDVTLAAAMLRTGMGPGTGGSLSAASLTTTLGGIDNRAGSIAVTGPGRLALAVAGTIDTSAGGRIGTNASDWTLSATRIDNTDGMIAHAGSGTLSLGATNGIDNTGGTIATGGNYALTASTLTNDRGSLTGSTASSVALTGALANAGGVLSADAGLAVRAGAVTNSGTIGSRDGAVSLIATSIVNQGGTVQGKDLTIDVGTGTIDNIASGSTSGRIGSQGALTLTAGALGNSGGLIHADGDAALTLATLANAGEISARQGLTITASGTLDNAGGALLGDRIALTAPGFVNHGGTVAGTLATSLQIAGLLDNGAGAIGAAQALTMTAGRLINGGAISGASQAGNDPASMVAISVSGAVDNLSGGAIWADHDLTLRGGTITNAGSIAAAGDASLGADMIDNSAGSGIFGAGNRLALTFGSGTVGTLALGRDLSLTATGDWMVGAGQTIVAPHDLTLDVAGAFTNAGTLGADHAATLTSSGNLTNQASGVLKSDALTMTAGGALDNAGLINGGRLTTLTVGALANSGRIYGDAVTIGATGDIKNAGAAAVIAARSGTLALFTPGTLTNIDDAMLYSGGDLIVAGHSADALGGFGQAGALINSSAMIQAQGNGLLAADTITNTRTIFTYAPQAIGQSNLVVGPYFYDPSDTDHRVTERFTRTSSATTVTADSGAGQILFGGDLSVTAKILFNLHSTISAAGDLSITADRLDNIALAATTYARDQGTYRYQEWFKPLLAGHRWGHSRTITLDRSLSIPAGTLTPAVIAAGGNLTLGVGVGAINNLLVDDQGNTVSESALLSGSPVTAGTAATDGFSYAGTSGTVAGSAVRSQQSAFGGVSGTVPVGSATGTGTNVTIAQAPRVDSSGSAQAGSTRTLFGKRVARIALAGDTTDGAALNGAPLTLAPGGAALLGQLSGLPTSAATAFRITLGGLFSFATPGAHYLIETDPAFTNRSRFLSSDYFLDRLGYDPTRVQQRLGDAGYEQQLVGRQLSVLTGTTRLAGYADADAQYRALLDAGVAYTRQFDLALGVGLTPAQMATLTTDIVLLVDVTVETPTGPQHALAPVVYLTKVHTGDLQKSGALIASGGTLDLRTSGSLTNSGVIRAVAGSSIAAGTTLTNGGVIAGGKVVSVSAGGDLLSRGGAFGGGDVTLAAGGNMRLDATAAATGRMVTGYAKGGTLTDGTAHTLTTLNATGALTVIARGDLNSQGAQLAAGTTATVRVGGTATLDAVNDGAADQTVRGTSVTGVAGVSVAAGLLDPTAKLVVNGGTIRAASGAVALSGSGGVAIGTADELHESTTTTLIHKGGLLSLTPTQRIDVTKSISAVGSTVSGTSVSVTSSQGDIAVTGSNMVGDKDVLLAAKGDVTIAGAQGVTTEDTASSANKSGASIRSTGGNVTIAAGGEIVNKGTIQAKNLVELVADRGDIANATGGLIAGGSVATSAGRDLLLAGGSTIRSDTGGVLQAGRNVVTQTISSTSQSATSSYRDDRHWSKSTTTSEQVSGATIAAGGNLTMRAGNDIDLHAASLTAGGSAQLAAAGKVTLGGVAAKSSTTGSARTGKYASATTTTTATNFVGTSVVAAGPVTLAAGADLTVTGGSVRTTDPATGGITLYGGQGIAITSAQETATLNTSARTGKKKSATTTATSISNQLANVEAAGGITLVSPGAVRVEGATVSGKGALMVDAASLTLTGVVDSVDARVDTVSKKSGLFSSSTKRTSKTTHDETVVASTLSGDTGLVTATDMVRITGANLVASNGLTLTAGGPVTIGTLTTTDTEQLRSSVKKGGLSLGGGGLFLGVAKTRSDGATESVTHNGSLVGSSGGDVTIAAGGAIAVKGSDVVSAGTTTLAGRSITVEHVTDTRDTTSASKSSSVGVSVGVQSPLLSAATSAVRMAGTATRSSDSRTRAVAGLAGGLAIKNGVDAAGDLADTLTSGTGSLGVSVGASFGISKSRSQAQGHDETVQASTIAGKDVVLSASGAGTASTITVTGSDIRAGHDLMLSAPGAITLAAASATDTMSGSSRSSGLSIGVSEELDLKGGKTSLSGPSVSVGFNSAKGRYGGTDVTNREATATAGNRTTVVTGGALTLDGATLAGNRVEVDAARLAIASRQDTSTYDASTKSLGVTVGLSAAGVPSVAGNLGAGRQRGDYASVAEQAGIRAGDGGFGIRIAGNTDLKGAVIASTATADRNSLATGTLTTSDIANREQYSARQTSLGGGISFGAIKGVGKTSEGDATVGTDKSNDLPGVKVAGLGTVSATPPVVLSASGGQSSTTKSAIAPGMITISSGDAASEQAAQTISRDTGSANPALTQAFDQARRAEIAQGFEAAQTLTNQVGTFLDNRAKDDARWRKDNPGVDPKTSPYAIWGAGGTGQLVLTALNGAAGSNVAGGLGSLVQASAVTALQGLATNKVKSLVDSLGGDVPTRAALQALTGCAGSVAGGSGDCGSAAMGAAAAVVLNRLLSTGTTTATDAQDKPLGLDAQQARDTLVSTIVAAVASGAGLGANAATTAARIETQNNSTTIPGLGRLDKNTPTGYDPQLAYGNDPAFKKLVDGLGGDLAAVLAVIDACVQSEASCRLSPDQQALVRQYNAWGASDAGKTVIAAASQQQVVRDSALDVMSHGDASARAALSAKLSDGSLSDSDLIAAAAFQRQYDSLSDTAKGQVRADLANADKPDTLGLGAAFGSVLSRLADPDTVQAMYFTQVQGRANLTDLAAGAGDAATPAAQFLADMGTLSSVADPDTGAINPYYRTPAGQAAVEAAQDRMAARAQALGGAASAAGSALLTFVADTAPPPWAGNPFYSPTRAELDADAARKAHALEMLKDGARAVATSIVKPAADVIDTCMLGGNAAARACGSAATNGAANLAVGIATDGLGRAIGSVASDAIAAGKATVAVKAEAKAVAGGVEQAAIDRAAVNALSPGNAQGIAKPVAVAGKTVAVPGAGAMPDAVPGKGVIATGDASAVQSATIQPGTTVKLTQPATLTDGTVFPSGSVVTATDNGYKVVGADGTARTYVTQAKPGSVLALPAPKGDIGPTNPKPRSVNAAESALRPTLGVLDDAAFAQVPAKISKQFSPTGQEIYSTAAGRPIKTVGDLTEALQQGHIMPNQVPLDYVMIDGQGVIANTRSSTALINAGIPKSQWFGVNRTGQIAYDNVTYDTLVQNQLNKNYGGSVSRARR